MRLSGTPTQGEIWTLTLGTDTFAYTVQFRDDLATIARKFGDMLRASTYLHTYDVVVVGRTLTITHDDESALDRELLDHAGRDARGEARARR